MQSAGKSVVGDVDIFATDSLRERLALAGLRFESDLQEELVLRAYENAGPACLGEFNGYFAIAVWDEKERVLTLARDPTGFRPLFVWQEGSKLAFASEYKALLAISDVPSVPDLESLQYLQSRKLIPLGRTLLKDVRAVSPATWVTHRDGRREQHTYWDIPLNVRTAGLTEQASRLREDFMESIRIRTDSSERIGVSLSGGVDSTCIAAALRQQKPNEEIHTFTAGSGPEDEDMHYAAKIADMLGTQHHEVIVGPDMIAETLPEVVWHLEDPIARSETLQYYITARRAREYVDVLLGGQIADGLYAGMPKHKIIRLVQRMPWLRGPLSEFYNYTQTGTPSRSLLGSMLQAIYFHGSVPPVPRIRGGGEIAPPADWPHGKEMLNQILRAGMLETVPQWLPKIDRLNQAHGLRVYSPFIDKIMIHRAFEISDRWKLRRLKEKYILRQALSGLLPKEFIDRPKYPQRMTYDVLFSQNLEDYAASVLAPADVKERGLFEPSDIARILRRQPGRPYSVEHGMRIWTALCTELWARIFVDHRGEYPS
jgi:asparagine synthase (glutamine-hydrolysing)